MNNEAENKNTADAVISVQTGDNTVTSSNDTTVNNTNTNDATNSVENANSNENTNQNQDSNENTVDNKDTNVNDVNATNNNNSNAVVDSSSNAVNNVVVNVTVIDSDSECSHVDAKQNGPERCEMTTNSPSDGYEVDVSRMSCEVTKHQVKEVLDAGLRILQGKPLTKSNIIQITYILWSVTKKMKVRSNIKKEILLAGVSALIDCQTDITPIDKQVLKLMVNDIISQVVDVVSRAKKDGADNCLTNCLSCCLGVPDPPELVEAEKRKCAEQNK